MFTFRKIWPTGNRCNRALLTWQKNSPGFPAVARARIVPKICYGNPLTVYSRVLQISSKSVHFREFRRSYSLTCEHRQNVLKVNTIFGGSLASSQINTHGHKVKNLLKPKQPRMTTHPYMQSCFCLIDILTRVIRGRAGFSEVDSLLFLWGLIGAGFYRRDDHPVTQPKTLNHRRTNHPPSVLLIYRLSPEGSASVDWSRRHSWAPAEGRCSSYTDSTTFVSNTIIMTQHGRQHLCSKRKPTSIAVCFKTN